MVLAVHLAAQHADTAMPVKFKDQHQFDPTLANYLAKPGPHCLEIGDGLYSFLEELSGLRSVPTTIRTIRLMEWRAFSINIQEENFLE